MESIGSWGIAAAVGAAAFVAAMAMAGGFRSGGYTGDGPRDEVAGFAHRGEFVVPAPTVERLGLARLEALTASPTVAAAAGPHRAGLAPAAPENRSVNVHVYLDRSAWLAATKDDIEGIAVDAMRRMS
jgi:hypothetical protein